MNENEVKEFLVKKAQEISDGTFKPRFIVYDIEKEEFVNESFVLDPRDPVALKALRVYQETLGVTNRDVPLQSSISTWLEQYDELSCTSLLRGECPDVHKNICCMYCPEVSLCLVKEKSHICESVRLGLVEDRSDCSDF